MDRESEQDTTPGAVPTARGRWLWRAALGATYMACLAALTLPAWIRPGSTALGHGDSDVWRHLWGDAWFLRDLGTAWPVPLSTDLLWYPDGGLLYNLDPLTGILVRVLAPVVGVVAAHNAIQLGSLLLGATGTYLLARRWCDPAGAAVAGAVYGFSAHLQGAVLASGIAETAHVGWFPLALLALVRLTDGRGWGWSMAGGAALALAAIGSWYYGLVASLAAVGWVAVWLVRRLLRRDATAPPLLPVAARLGVAAALAGLLVLPFVQAFRASLDPARALHDVAVMGVLDGDLSPRYNVAVATVRDFVVPADPRIGRARDLLMICHHPGFLPVVLALAAFLARRPGYRWLAAAAVLALALTMGPRIHLDADTPLLANPVFLAFQHLWPGGGAVRNLERLQVAFTLCLALLAGLGVGWLLPLFGLRGIARRACGLGLVVLLVVEANLVSGLGFPLPTADATVPPLYERLDGEDGEFGILELPHTDGPTGKVFWHQVSHGRPLPYNFEGQVAPSLTGNPLLSALIADRAFHLQFKGLRRGMTRGELEKGRQELVQQGFRFAMVTDRPGDEDLIAVESVLDVLERTAGPPVGRDEERGLFLFDLASPDVSPGRGRRR